jgi:hypothetical protein
MYIDTQARTEGKGGGRRSKWRKKTNNKLHTKKKKCGIQGTREKSVDVKN